MKVLITGASSGIGRDIARLLANKYDELILVGRDIKRLNDLKEEISTKDNIVYIESLDLSLQDNCLKLHKKYKDVDLLINNAGFGEHGKFDKTSLEKETMMINTNIVACHTLTKLYLKDMKEKNSGHILNVASIAGFMPGPYMATYYATKNYVVRLSEAIRQEIKKDKSKVKISVLCPGPVNTNFVENANINFFFIGMSSKAVAKYTIKHLNRFYIVPGFLIKIGRFLIRILPVSLVSKIISILQKRK